VLDLVLRPPGAQRFGKIVPELEQSRVQHLEDAADVPRTVAIQVEGAGRGVEVVGRRTVAVAIEKAEGDQRVEEVADAAGVHADFGTELSAGHRSTGQPGEHTEFDGGQENLGRPERESGREDGRHVHGCVCSCAGWIHG
jgi:hypothetical protein